MKLTLPLACAPMLAVFLAAATNRQPPVGFADLPRLLAVHPLHKVLDGYDREIAALRNTQTVPGLNDLSTQTQRGAVALQHGVAAARSQIQRIASTNAQRDRASEGQALSAVLASRHAANREMNAYRDELARETTANLSGYATAIRLRTERAFAARQQQLREKELTLAFDLARRNSGTRLMLRLKLQDLHLDHAARATLQAELAAINQRDSKALAAMRREDAAALESYRHQLQREGEAANAQMATQLRSKAEVNLALRLHVLQSASSSANVVPNLSSRLASFASSYRFGADAAVISDGLRSAGTDLPQRFTRLGDLDRRSRAETAAQIEALQTYRSQLYRSMIAQIARDAQRLVRQRHLRGVVVSSARPKGSVDLTGALAAEFARF